jgi:hypothetical protein
MAMAIYDAPSRALLRRDRRGWIVSPRLSIATISAILAARFSGVFAWWTR